MDQVATIVDPAKIEVLEYEMPEAYDGQIHSPEDRSIRIYNCFGKASTFLPGPQGFVVDAPAPTDVASHWHPVNQFQLYVGAPGVWYQRTDVGELLLHYTDAFATYGPFGSHGPAHLKYYTLRSKASDLTGWMPKDRERMLRRGRRNELIPLESPADVATAVDEGWVAVHGPEPDGLAVLRRFVAPGQSLAAPELPDPAVGRFYCVLAGALLLHGERFPESSLIWEDHASPLPAIAADPEIGCDMLAMQYPPEVA